ncbi:protein of unknown function [Pedobacter steynii]|uniref:Lnb N-terminal periplasmic domain-containing protein n=1 Tax=Pedobacter steynii TaxID=430522 RepID=A0A1H0LHJ8_9SPHI|nr:DUF4105 domain-containing protein [Pedobacter steynii]NQX43480.1 DUF4105 domain-containing protein [Pedobacter steynii]SDO67622.1 protein of unknown function [Pedobacter steynii]
MRILKRFLILSIFFLLCQKTSISSPIPSFHNISVSLLTCEKTDRYIYALFGHSAIRIRDEARQLDLVYNYGTFDTTDPGFYFNFLHGRMKYFLSRTDYQTFIRSYLMDEQSVTEQKLQLSEAQKSKLISILQTQIKPENRSYNYDFVGKNCSTKIIDLLSESIGPDFDRSLSQVSQGKGPSIREQLGAYLKHNEFEMIGMNIFLGKQSDTLTNRSLSLFLPDTLRKRIDEMQSQERKFSGPITYLFKANPNTRGSTSLLSTLFYGLNLLLLFPILGRLLIDIRKYPVLKLFASFLSGSFLLLLSATGLLLIYLSVYSELDLMRHNFNILWCHPFYPALFFRKTSKMAAIIFLAGILTFIFLSINTMPFPAFFPLLLLLILWLSFHILPGKG